MFLDRLSFWSWSQKAQASSWTIFPRAGTADLYPLTQFFLSFFFKTWVPGKYLILMLGLTELSLAFLSFVPTFLSPNQSRAENLALVIFRHTPKSVWNLDLPCWWWFCVFMEVHWIKFLCALGGTSTDWKTRLW